MLYFQWRRGRGGSEKLHGAVVEHAGRTDTRVFREVSQLGAELKTLGDSFLGATTQSRVGIVFDWDNWHALDNAIGPVRDKRYYQTVAKHYESFYRQQVPVDVLYADSDLSQYDIVIAPMMYMVKADFAERVKRFVAQGGTFVSTYFSGIVDETDLAFENGYPGPLADMLGIWVEEIDALYEGESNSIVMADGSGTFTCDHLTDLLHPEGADVLATYGSDFYVGMPVLTKNQYGAGAAYYIASNPEDAFLDAFYSSVLAEKGIQPVWKAPAGVEIAVRQKEDQSFVFVLNHNAQAVDVDLGSGTFHDLLQDSATSGAFTLAPYDVRVLMTEAL